MPISADTIYKFIKTLGINTKYNFSFTEAMAVSEYIYTKFVWTGYQTQLSKMILMDDLKIAGLVWPEHRDKILGYMHKTFHDEDYAIYAYAKNDINNSHAVHFLKKFTGCSLQEIIAAGHSLRVDKYSFKNNLKNLTPLINKIVDYHLVINLAQRFYFIEFFTRNGISPMLHIDFGDYYLNLNYAIKKETKINILDHIKSYDKNKIKNLNNFSDGLYQSFLEIKKFLIDGYSLLHNYYSKIPDLEILTGDSSIGKIGTNIISLVYIKYLMDNPNINTIPTVPAELKLPEIIKINKCLTIEI